MASYSISDSVKCLEGVDYDVVKHNAHFEWVVEFEKTIKELSLEVFETLGVNDENTLKIAVDLFDEHQQSLMTKIDVLVKQIVDNANYNDSAKSFIADWSDALKYQVSLKYHYMGGGPTSQKLRWGYESSIKYIVVCATHLATKDDNVQFKKEVSNFVKDNFIQTLIDALRTLKSKIEALKSSSS